MPEPDGPTRWRRPGRGGSDRSTNVPRGGPCGAAYFLGFLGAVVHYIQAAASFGGAVLGVLKAAVWPAFLVHALLRLAGA